MSSTFASALARTVRARRLEEHLTQTDLADLAGVSERFIRSVEHGKPTLRLDSVEAVLKALGLNLAVTGRANISVPAEAEHDGNE